MAHTATTALFSEAKPETMPYTPFMPEFDQLPETLPVFPLSDAVVMPGADLPLNIYEPRYLDMVADALGRHRMFGMVQPDPTRDEEPEALFRTGCGGRISRYVETSDGRIELVLTGLCRFSIREELPGKHGYRLVVPDWEPYRTDYELSRSNDFEHRDRLIQLLESFFTATRMETDWKKLLTIPADRLVNTLTTVLPLDSMEKQALLEAVTPQD
ncbi:MAG TPA: LON peptidase substrate-binding domain-containing protein, partial [Gammaproteobacteria bacterium]|nr:LON peptidase substrate-binding domain-containing protein [Gammaproteobacteria bacterium]